VGKVDGDEDGPLGRYMSGGYMPWDVHICVYR
jgi:hypothetical protein